MRIKKLAEVNYFGEQHFIPTEAVSRLAKVLSLWLQEIVLIKSYCFSQPSSFELVSASSFSLVSMSMPAGTLKLALGGLVESVASISVAPMDSRLVRTVETQLPQVMPGTLMETFVISPVAVDDVLPPELSLSAGVAGVAGAAGSPQPMMPTIMASARQESKLRI